VNDEFERNETGCQVGSNGKHEGSQGNFCPDLIQVATEKESQMHLFIYCM